MKRFLTYIILLSALLVQTVYGQVGKTVSGVISDNRGPIPGASIYEKEATANGTTSGQDGKFTLRLKGSSGVLIIKSIGYLTREIGTGSRTSINVTLEEDAKGLEEVVVLGFGEKAKKITNTGAVSSISGKEIRQSPTASIQNSLAGRLPGFFSQQRSGQPGKDGAAFQIRGISTYQGTTTPLIIVDDIEVTADQINMLDQNEIESLTILKDASTTAVYGVRGANGVVVVRTRRGESGKPQLTFRQETGLTRSAVNFKTNNGYTTLKMLNEYTTEQYMDPATQYPKFFGGNNLEHYRLQDDPYNYPFVDWWDELTKDYSIQNRSNFDISGGTQKTKYFVSLGYFSQGGMYKDFTKDEGYNGDYQFDRYNFRSNVDLDPNKNLHIRFDLSGRFGVTNSPNDSPGNGGAPTLQYLWNGQLSAFGFPAYNANGTYGGSTSGSTKINPIANLRWSGYSRDYTNNLGFVTQVDQKLNFITEGLTANALLSYASDYSFNRSLKRSSSEIPTYYYDANTSSYLPVVNNLYRLGKLTRSGGYTGSNRLTNLQASLKYNRSFASHNINAFVLLNQTTKTEETSAIAYDPYNVRGIVTSFSYNYKQKYLLDFKGAYNGSDKFQSSKKYQFFPALSVAYNISEEPFFKNNINFIDNLKIRGSYGMVGNDGIGSSVYSYEKTYVGGSGKGYIFGETGNTTYGGLIEPTLANTEITWETQRDANIGLELRMFKGRLGLNVDFYKKRREDILTQRASVATAFGASLPFVNLGIVDNKGYEVELTYKDNLFANKLSYFVNTQISHSENKVIFRDEGAVRYPWLGLTGKPVGALFAYQDAGLYQSLADLYNSPKLITATPLSNLSLGGVKLVDLNGDGIIDQYDLGYVGTNQPEYIAGLSFGFSYKNFDFSTLFQSSFKYFININRGVIGYSRPENQSIPYNLGRWTPVTRQEATFPVLAGSGSQSGVFSTYWTKRGDYIRWKNVEIGYRLPTSFAKKLHMNNIRVYANGYNLGLLYTALPVFIDPESVTGTASTTNLGDVNEYPQQSIFNFGIQFGL
ncbi:TonB-dependent receptor SusC [Pedobacter sp. Bi27]|uniref:SusC/RagA family TonB-linked outer membrane protein n=1 Tax=unclassified Pedobacter TaxID=2628915 RepID=UPI001E0C2E24|nr:MULTISPECIES: TonB-dependent receptor [unclassified Pedobacter]CAH0155383.1 TonB-dependent receptor SusC [Pedobacter sp. Bi36]CAH0211612.1 TonB-dependent receptor SusC [Pedobacter sp. Bi126]CAH0269138.1 TonB-dependent receptor SusC [Pedobacter sp. Bi27]